LIRNRLLGLFIALVATVGGTATVSPALASADLTGAGSTLVAPLMSNWISGFEAREGIKVTYGAVGSGSGIQQISARTVDFGASDAPLTPEQAGKCNGCVQVPWGLSAIAIGFNVPGVKKLNLTGNLLSSIYLGKITKWNDPKIKKINPKAHLPNLTITPVFRSDGSGTTYGFARYLSKVSPAWKKTVGYATSISFPTGVGAKGNPGVKNTVVATQGSVGYMEVSYTIAAGLGAASIQNKAGRFILPNLKNIQAAAAIVKRVPANNELTISDPPKRAKTAYPISTFTYAIVPHDAAQKDTVKRFVKYCATTGQKYGPALDFAPMPKVVTQAALRAIASL
jgi:phosphate transport system substrate-binding protein